MGRTETKRGKSRRGGGTSHNLAFATAGAEFSDDLAAAKSCDHRSEPRANSGGRTLTKVATMTSQHVKYPAWQGEFEAAIAEGDPKTLRQRVDAAESAIFVRLQSVMGDEERQALHEATQRLRVIQKDKLGYPDWNKR